MIEFKQIEECDVLELIENARQGDIDEVYAASGMTLEDGLRDSIKKSDWVSVATRHGKVVCIFGLADLSYLSGYGRPWMLGTHVIDQHPLEFYRDSQFWFARFLEVAPNLENYVHVKNAKAIRWLARLGFKFDDDEVEGWYGEKLKRFYIA